MRKAEATTPGLTWAAKRKVKVQQVVRRLFIRRWQPHVRHDAMLACQHLRIQWLCVTGVSDNLEIALSSGAWAAMRKISICSRSCAAGSSANGTSAAMLCLPVSICASRGSHHRGSSKSWYVGKEQDPGQHSSNAPLQDSGCPAIATQTNLVADF